MTIKVLLVEDDLALAAKLRHGLRGHECHVHWTQNGPSADAALLEHGPDLVVLDWVLSRRSGLDLLDTMRARGDLTPVLILSGRDSVRDRVEALDAGGDDYMVKPADVEELAARLRALYRRRTGFRPPLLQHGNLTVDPASRGTCMNEKPVHLSRHEFSLLCLLLEQRGRVLPRSELETNLYGWSVDVESNTIEVHIHALRRKLGTGLIRTVRGVGYIIDQPV